MRNPKPEVAPIPHDEHPAAHGGEHGHGHGPRARRPSWKDPRTWVGIAAFLAYLGFSAYMTSQADSWSRLIAIYNPFVSIATAVIGGIFGIRISGGRVKDAKREKHRAQHERQHAEQGRHEAEKHLGRSKQTLAKAQMVLDDLAKTHARRARDKSRHLPDIDLLTANVSGSASRSLAGAIRRLPLVDVDPEVDRLSEQARALSNEIEDVLST